MAFVFFCHFRVINVWHRCCGPCSFGVDITQNRTHVVAMQFSAADVPLAHDTCLVPLRNEGASEGSLWNLTRYDDNRT